MNADCEVKKLKDLVKKLERQNQHLRHKTGKLGPYARNVDLPRYSTSGRNASSNDNIQPIQTGLPPDHILEEYCLEKLQAAKETDWLYSANGYGIDENRLVLEQWLRHELDHPRTEKLVVAKKDIICLLNVIYTTKKSSIGVKDFETHHFIKSATELTASEDFAHHITPSIGAYEHKAEKVQDIQRMPLPSSAKAAIHSVTPTSQRGQSPTRTSRPHMPLPSHTMASAHGLIPTDSGKEHHIRVIPTPLQTPECRRQRSPSPPSSSENPLVAKRDIPLRKSRAKGRMGYKSSHGRGIPFPSSSKLGTNGVRGVSTSTTGLRNRESSPVVEPNDVVESANNELHITRSDGHYLVTESEHARTHSPKGNLPSSSQRVISSNSYQKTHFQSSQWSDANLTIFDSLPPVQTLKVKVLNQTVPRKSLPRPSRGSRNQRSSLRGDIGTKSGPRGLNHRMQNHKADDTASDASGSQASDVWKDGEFF